MMCWNDQNFSDEDLARGYFNGYCRNCKCASGIRNAEMEYKILIFEIHNEYSEINGKKFLKKAVTTNYQSHWGIIPAGER